MIILGNSSLKGDSYSRSVWVAICLVGICRSCPTFPQASPLNEIRYEFFNRKRPQSSLYGSLDRLTLTTWFHHSRRSLHWVGPKDRMLPREQSGREGGRPLLVSTLKEGEGGRPSPLPSLPMNHSQIKSRLLYSFRYLPPCQCDIHSSY